MNIEKTSTLFQWIKTLEEKKNFSSTMEYFFLTCQVPATYFSYDFEKGHLNLQFSKNLNPSSFTKCIRLHELDPFFEPSLLFHPQKVSSLHQTLKASLGSEFYNYYHLLFRNQIQGIFVGLWNKEPYKSSINTQLFVLHQYLKQLFWEKTCPPDPGLNIELKDCLNPRAFLQNLFIEVSRSRHLRLPLCLILIEIDSFDFLTKFYGSYKTLILKKAILNQLRIENRTYDTLGTWPKIGRLGIILPYTSIETAKQKAEKLRTLLGKADFSKVFPKHPHISISLGLAEYPRVTRSADALLKACLKALHVAKLQYNGDLIAVANPVAEFKPDFLTPQQK